MTTEATAQAGTGDEKPDTGAGAGDKGAEAAAAAAAGADGAQSGDAAAKGDETLAGGNADTEKAVDPGKTPQAPDWRAALAGDDKKFLDRLGRFAAPGDFGKSFRALEQKLSSGEYKRALPENASAEEVAAWRKDNGVPEKPEGYEVKLPDGLVLGKEDQPVVDLFKGFAHSKNLTAQQFNDILTFHYETQDALASQRAEKDAEFKTTAEDALRTEYGQDFRRNMNVLGTVRDSMPEGLADRLLGGRMADGTVAGNDPAMIRWLVSLGLEINPTATLLPPGGGDVGKATEARLEEIRKIARENPDKYDNDKALQKEQQDLIAAQNKRRSRAA